MRPKTPANQIPITLGYTSIDTKLYRDQFCIECGHPFVAISDKFITVLDGDVEVQQLRREEKVVEARCRFHYCKQYFRIYTRSIDETIKQQRLG